MSQIDYETKSNEELQDIARERGVEGLDAYRKSDLRKLLAAQDAKDSKMVSAVVDAVRARATATKAEPKVEPKNDLASRIMDKAKQNAGLPVLTGPREDLAGIQAGASLEDAKAAAAAAGVAPTEPPPPTKLDLSSSGEDIVRQIQERALQMMAAPVGNPRRSSALEALRLAEAQNGPARGNVPEIEEYVVLEDSRYFTPHGFYNLANGSIVSERTHDMNVLRSNSCKMERIDSSKTKLVCNEFGQPIGVSTTPLEAPAMAKE